LITQVLYWVHMLADSADLVQFWVLPVHCSGKCAVRDACESVCGGDVGGRCVGVFCDCCGQAGGVSFDGDLWEDDN